MKTSMHLLTILAISFFVLIGCNSASENSSQNQAEEPTLNQEVATNDPVISNGIEMPPSPADVMRNGRVSSTQAKYIFPPGGSNN